MTEQQIRDGYDELTGALRPPVDAHERVARRVQVRRRRRRTSFVGMAALVVVGTAGVVATLNGASGVGGLDGEVIAVDPPSDPTEALVLTRPDGSTYEFDDITVSCKSPYGPGGGGSNTSSKRVWASSPMKFTQPDGPDGDESLLEPFLVVEGLVPRLQGETTFTLPIDGPRGSSSYPLIVFAADPEGAPDGNEVSSDGGSSGTVRVLEASCDPVPVLRLQIDATLGSEEGKQSLKLAGDVTARRD